MPGGCGALIYAVAAGSCIASGACRETGRMPPWIICASASCRTVWGSDAPVRRQLPQPACGRRCSRSACSRLSAWRTTDIVSRSSRYATPRLADPRFMPYLREQARLGQVERKTCRARKVSKSPPHQARTSRSRKPVCGVRALPWLRSAPCLSQYPSIRFSVLSLGLRACHDRYKLRHMRCAAWRQPMLQPIEIKIDHRRRVEREHLAQSQPANHSETQRLA